MANTPSEGGIKRVRRSPKKRTAVQRKTAQTAAEPQTLDELVGDAGQDTRPGFFETQFSLSVRENDIVVFLRQLIMLLEAGTPLLRSLQTLADRSERPRVRALLSDIAQYVEMGNPLWQAFDRHPKWFDRVFVNLVKASEASGTLVTVLGRLVEYRERRQRFVRRVQSALVYPVVVVLACYGVVLIVGKWVLPEFRDVFEKMGVEPPWMTTAFLTVTQTLAKFWVIALILIVIVGLFLLYRSLVRNPLFRLRADRVKLAIPYIGPNIVRKSAIVEMTRTMSLLLSSGLSMMITLELTRNSIRNRAVAQVLQDVRDSVERGEGIEEPLRQHPRLVPPVITDMLVTGEESGRLDDITGQIAARYEDEVDTHVNTLSDLLPVGLVFLMGLFVVALALSVFVPMVQMLEQLGQ